MSGAGIRHPLLTACGVTHSFGERDTIAPRGVLCPRQVHGRVVSEVDDRGVLVPEVADAVVSTRGGCSVGIVTADCVPILAASESGAAVAAIHAGWRGLASGVIPAAVERLAALAWGETLSAVVGPHIGPAHYEVDEPVIEALRPRFGEGLGAALAPTRPGHAHLDLGRLALDALQRAGLARERVAALPDACTFSDADRFHSYRRDGAAAGRLLHSIAASGSRSTLDRGGSQT